MAFVAALGESERLALRQAVAAQGFGAAGPPAIAEEQLALLCAEAEGQRSQGWGRASGKAVDHRNWRAELGPAARAFLSAPETLRLVGDVVGEAVTPSFEATCFTYYEGPLDFLGVHRDRPHACAYTLILYLTAAWPPTAEPGSGMELQVFRSQDATGEEEPVVRIPTRGNVLVIGRGAEVPHCRPPLRDGESVVALTACFAPAAPMPVRVGQPQSAAMILIEEGFSEWRQGEVAEAEARFAAALQHDPTAAQAWNGCGFVRWSRGEFAEALQMFMTAARCDGSSASIWSNIGLCLRELKAFDRALNAFSVALMLDPAYAPALNEWGNVLQDQGRQTEALTYYERALALDSSRAVVHHNLGVAYSRLGEAALAVQAFTAALDRDPGYVHSLEEIGALCMRGGLVEQGRAFLARAGTPRSAALVSELDIAAPAHLRAH